MAYTKRFPWKKIISALFIIGILILLVFLVTWTPERSSEPLQTAEVSARDLQKTVSDSGVITKRSIDDEDELIIQWMVDELDIANIHQEDTVSIDIEALDVTNLQATVYELADDPTIVGELTTYEAILRFEETPEHLRVGMHTDNTIVIDSMDDILSVPNDSLYTIDDQYFVDVVTEKRRVYLERLGVNTTVQNYTPTVVEIDFEGDEYTEIADGLKEGQVIVAE